MVKSSNASLVSLHAQASRDASICIPALRFRGANASAESVKAPRSQVLSSSFLADDVVHGGRPRPRSQLRERRAVRSAWTVRVFACVRAGAWAAFVAFVALASRVAYAKPLDVRGHDWEGLSDFVQAAQEEIGDARVIPAFALDFDDMKREDGVVLIHPERNLDIQGFAAFMRSGGRVVLLDDFGSGDVLLRHFGLERVPMPTRPAEFLRNNPQFAIAEPASSHPIVRDVSKLVTNHPTGLRAQDLSPVLKFRGVDGPDVMLAQAGAVGEGRFLAVGDGSILMNSMLRFPGNRAFARGIVRYAVEDDNHFKRSGRLFIASGDFEERGTFGEREGLDKQLHERLRDAKNALAATQKDGLPSSVLYILAVTAGLSIVLWVGSRAGRTHRTSRPRFTRGIPVLAQGGVAGHAAVIGAPKTSRALALLEIKSAFEEGLASVLGLEHVPSQEELIRRINEARILDADAMRTLKQLLLRMASVETLVLSRKSDAAARQRVRDKDIVEAALMVKKVLNLAQTRVRDEARGERVPA
jgi:hypothetical protein